MAHARDLPSFRPVKILFLHRSPPEQYVTKNSSTTVRGAPRTRAPPHRTTAARPRRRSSRMCAALDVAGIATWQRRSLRIHFSSACGHVVTPNGRSGASASAGRVAPSRLPSPNGRITMTPRPRSAAAGRISCLDVALARVVGNLDRLHPRIRHHLQQLAEGVPTVVRDADDADGAARLQPFELREPLRPGEQVVDLVDVDAAAEVAERAGDLLLRLAVVGRPDLGRDDGLLAAAFERAARARAPPRRTSATSRRSVAPVSNAASVDLAPLRRPPLPRTSKVCHVPIPMTGTSMPVVPNARRSTAASLSRIAARRISIGHRAGSSSSR